MPRALLAQGARFLLVAVLGLAIDVSLASMLAFSGVPLAIAASGGFAAGLAFNYVAHAFFTFRQPRAQTSLRQAGAFVGASLAVLGIRLAVLAALQWAVPAPYRHPTLLILIAAGASFLANFLILRRLVFGRAVRGRPYPVSDLE